jgi:hypothetical protein
VLLVLGEPEMHVESAAVKILPRRIRPVVIAALQKISFVYIDRTPERFSGIAIVVGSGRVDKLVLELPQVSGDLRCSRLVLLTNLGDYLEGFRFEPAKPGAQVTERIPELPLDSFRRGVRPDRLDGFIAGGAIGPEQVPRQECFGPAAQSPLDLLAVRYFCGARTTRS